MKLLIVDDEPLARSALIQLCSRSPDVDVVGEAECGVAAIHAADKLRPDVMLLDVGLPDMTGFDVLRVARSERRPLGIMVTAHADHAATAFEAGALDYLVKPVSADRFAQSIERARQRVEPPRNRAEQTLLQPQPAHDHHGNPGSAFKLLIGEREHRLYPISAESVDYIESDGNYVTLRSGSAKYISRTL
jgi:DNA-binding LytR/AlgR family response regulator